MNKQLEKTAECYDDSQLKLFLSESLPQRMEAGFLAHLDNCEFCQITLEQCVASKGQWESVCNKLESRGLSTWQNWHENPSLSSMFETRQCPNHGSSEEVSHGVGRLLEILNPSEFPRSVGRLGSYEIFGLVGQGSAGIVLKAWDPKLHRFVAIKVLSPTFSDNGPARQRFQREAKAIAAVSSRQVVPIHAVHEFRNLPYIVMPYLAGGSLQQRIEKQGALEIKEVVRIAMQIATGLQAAHSQGIVHRDVKPANVLLEEGIDRALVGDFGLARVSDDAAATRSGVIAGTPHFMSPEQASGGAVDPRSDLFSLGSVMYCACTGRLPFQSDSIFGVIKKVCDSQPESILNLNPDVDPWLVDFIQVLHHKDKEMRFSSAAQVADSLQAELAYHNNPKVAPKPDRSFYSGKAKTIRRQTVVFATVALVFAACLGTVAASVFSNGNESKNGNNLLALASTDQEKTASQKQEKVKSKDQKLSKTKKKTGSGYVSVASTGGGTVSTTVSGTTAKASNIRSGSVSSGRTFSGPVNLKGVTGTVSSTNPTGKTLQGSIGRTSQTIGRINRRVSGTVRGGRVSGGVSQTNGMVDRARNGRAQGKKSFVEVLQELKKLPEFIGIIKHTAKVKNGGTLHVDSSWADVSIQPAATSEVSFEIKRVVRAKDKKEADELFSHHRYSFNDHPKGFISGKDASVKTWFTKEYLEARKLTNYSINPYRNVKIRITVPHNFQIDVKTDGGDVCMPAPKGDVRKKFGAKNMLKGNVNILTHGGDIDLGTVSGNVSMKTHGGDVYLVEAGGEVTIHTRGGDIDAGFLRNKSTVSTGGGDISIRRCEEFSTINTGGGEIEVRNASGGVKAISGGGEVSIRFAGDPTADSMIQTRAGEIDIVLPREVNCKIDASVAVGRIDGIRQGKKRGRRVEKVLGKGGKTITVRSGAGEIDFGFYGKKTPPAGTKSSGSGTESDTKPSTKKAKVKLKQ